MLSIGKAHRIWPMLIALLVINICAGNTPAQLDPYERWENGISEPWWFISEIEPKKDIDNTKARWALIGADKGSQANAWAGDYFRGSEVHGTYFRWSPQSGFVLLSVDKCMAAVMSMDYGRVAASATLVQFFPERKQSVSGSHARHKATFAMKLLPVKWGGRRYLVPEDEIADFGNFVAGFMEYNDFFGRSIDGAVPFFVRLDDNGDGSARDLPIVPPGYERFIKKPIDAKITAVGTSYRKLDRENDWWDNLVIPVTVSVGAAHGVARKMSFRLPDVEAEERIEITKVGLRSSQGIIVRSIRKKRCVKIDKTDDCKNPEYREIRVGRDATTSPFD